jgi:hypothetical protein
MAFLLSTPTLLVRSETNMEQYVGRSIVVVDHDPAWPAIFEAGTILPNVIGGPATRLSELRWQQRPY